MGGFHGEYPWGLHARPSAFIAMVGMRFFPGRSFVAVNPRTGLEGDAASILDLMKLVVPCREEIGFFGRVPMDVWREYVSVLGALFFFQGAGSAPGYGAVGSVFDSMERPDGSADDRALLLQRSEAPKGCG